MKKESLGIDLIALFHLIFAIFLSTAYIMFYIETHPVIPPIISLAFIVMYYVIAYGLFKKRHKVYYFLLGFAFYRVSAACIFSFGYAFEIPFPTKKFIVDMIFAVFYGFILYYFTRPKIMEQFKQTLHSYQRDVTRKEKN